MGTEINKSESRMTQYESRISSEFNTFRKFVYAVTFLTAKLCGTPIRDPFVLIKGRRHGIASNSLEFKRVK